jgi:hypothetical protein
MMVQINDYDFDPGANWCPDCGEPRGVCRCDELGGNKHGDWDYVDYEDFEDDDDYCELCDGEGVIITCCDDICVGGGHCIHGDGEEVCPKCHGGY